jgi:hypothetical protein
MYISEWDLHGAATSYQQLVPQGEIYRDMAFLHVYMNGIYIAATNYNQMGSTQQLRLLPA